MSRTCNDINITISAGEGRGGGSVVLIPIIETSYKKRINPLEQRRAAVFASRNYKPVLKYANSTTIVIVAVYTPRASRKRVTEHACTTFYIRRNRGGGGGGVETQLNSKRYLIFNSPL